MADAHAAVAAAGEPHDEDEPLPQPAWDDPWPWHAGAGVPALRRALLAAMCGTARALLRFEPSKVCCCADARPRRRARQPPMLCALA
jgi:hypothetical protein